MERSANGHGANGATAMSEDKVKQFWDDQASEYGTSGEATIPDMNYRVLEIENIKRHLRGERVLDVGCGNGFSTIQFKDAYPEWSFTGVDYSDQMIMQAVQADPKMRVSFIPGDVRTLSKDVKGKFDTIVSERCLINLPTWEEQAAGLLEMKKLLAANGRIVLVENFTDGLKNLNDLRANFDLHETKVRWHNRYLEAEQFYEFCAKHFEIEFAENIGNLYYIVSRVVYAKIAEMGGSEPEYEHPINGIAAALPSLGNYNYSPNMLHVLSVK